jgi:hypothetical protein
MTPTELGAVIWSRVMAVLDPACEANPSTAARVKRNFFMWFIGIRY